jgi:general secretion pathway protein N
MKRITLAQWLGIGLGSLCAVLMLLMLAQRFGFGRGYEELDELSEPLDMALLAPLKQSGHALPPDAHYIQVEQRPLFNNDRKPTVVKAPPPAPDAGPPIVALNASLTGTIISNGKRLALVRDNTTSKVIVMRPGMPMPGELMGWKLVSVDARSAVFDGGPMQGRAELKLDVSKTTGPALAPPPPPPGQAPVPAPGQPQLADQVPPPQPTPADQAAKEEEVRRIIEERRAQMRAEAAKMGGN